MIQTNNISKKYGQVEVLNIDSLEIPTGQSFGLVGNNGAGKTTYFNLLLDLIKPTTGNVANNSIVVNESEEWKTFTAMINSLKSISNCLRMLLLLNI